MIFLNGIQPFQKNTQLSTFQPNLSIKAWKLPFFFTSSPSWRFSSSLVVEVSTHSLVVGSSPQGSGVKHRKSEWYIGSPHLAGFYPHSFGAVSGSWYATLWKKIVRNDWKQICVSLDEDALVNACNMQEADKFKITSLNINKLYKKVCPISWELIC